MVGTFFKIKAFAKLLVVIVFNLVEEYKMKVTPLSAKRNIVFFSGLEGM